MLAKTRISSSGWKLSWLRGWPAGLLFLCLAAGCSEPSDYREISGSVTYCGERIAEGAIQFYTSDPALATVNGSTPAPAAGAVIKNGKYVVPAAHGIKAGKYVVRISARERAVNPKEPDNPFFSKETIPDKYNDRSILTIDLEPKGRTTFDFGLE